MSIYLEYPVIQVRPYGLLTYTQRELPRSKRNNHSFTREKKESYTGKLTTFSKKKLKRAIGLMVEVAKDKEATNFKTNKTFRFKINFITFTLPAPQGNVDDKTIKTCLNNWIKRARRKHKLCSYVWRAERQANGNIHFHMITDTYIHFRVVRDDWNEVLKPTGLIDKFKAKHHHENPNSTDIHAVWKVKNLVQYFVKYMSKEHKDGEEPIQGKIWDCSTNLKTKENCWEIMEGIYYDNFFELSKNKTIKRIDDTMFTILLIPKTKWKEYICPELLKKWDEYIERIRLKGYELGDVS